MATATSKAISARSRKVVPIPSDSRLPAAFRRRFSPKSGFAVQFSPKAVASVFIDKRLTTGPLQRRLSYMQSDSQMAAVIRTCAGRIWTLHTEPLSTGRFGMIVYTQKGKAIAAGQGRMTGRGHLSGHIETLYPGIRNAIKVTVSTDFKTDVKPGQTEPEYTVTVSVKAEGSVC